MYLNEDSLSSCYESLTEIVQWPYFLHNIELTNHCPMKCVYCPRSSMTRPLGYMDLNLFYSLIDQYIIDNNECTSRKINNQTTVHHLGESLMHPQFDCAISYMEEKDIASTISLNPILLTKEKTERLIHANPSHIIVSIDGYDDESFFRARGMKNAWSRSFENILYLLQEKEKRSNKSIIQLNCIDVPDFNDDIDRAEQFWFKEYGIQLNRKMFNTWNGSIDTISHFSKNSTNEPCFTPWTRMSIAYDGRVLSCCRDYDAFYILGDVKKEKLSDIWNNDPIRRLRREIKSGEITNKLCKQCSRAFGISKNVNIDIDLLPPMIRYVLKTYCFN